MVSSFFLFRGDGGQSASGAVKGGRGPVSFGVWCETVRRRRRLFLFWAGGGAQRLTRVRKCALSGSDFVRKGFCQEGDFVRKGFC